jgi:hypothetical protein
MEENKFDYESFKREAIERLNTGNGFSGKDSSSKSSKLTDDTVY